MTQKGTILLTGATGFVGMELLARYLERSDRDIVALVRAPSDEAATARMDAVLANLFGVRRAAGYASPGQGGRRRADRLADGAERPSLYGAGREGEHDHPLGRIGVVLAAS